MILYIAYAIIKISTKLHERHKTVNTLINKVIQIDEQLKLRAADAGYYGVDIARFAEELVDDIILESFPDGLTLPSSWTYENKVTYIAKQELL